MTEGSVGNHGIDRVGRRRLSCLIRTIGIRTVVIQSIDGNPQKSEFSRMISAARLGRSRYLVSPKMVVDCSRKYASARISLVLPSPLYYKWHAQNHRA